MVGIQSHFSTHPLVTRFRQILQDVATYYTKKLDMLKIKLEHHQNTKPNAYHVQLAKDLMEVYRGQTDWDQLWKDMFCRWKERITIAYFPFMCQQFFISDCWVVRPTSPMWQGRCKTGCGRPGLSGPEYVLASKTFTEKGTR